jgi:hypothetical protein
VKLRFGPLLNSTGIDRGQDQREDVHHIAFGSEKTVGSLKKRGAYV